MKLERPYQLQRPTTEKKRSERSKVRGRPKGAATKGRPLGAHSRYYRVSSIAPLDKRTVEFRYLDKVRTELLAHCGPDPTVVQKMLIERAAILSLRLAQIDRKIYDGGDTFTQVDNNMTISWQNALTKCLTAIGIYEPAARHGPTVAFKDVMRELGGGYADAAE